MDTIFKSFQKGDLRSADIIRIQHMLNILGSGPILEDGIYGKQTLHGTRHFQSTHCDGHGHPLVIDGIVGPETWSSLFEEVLPPVMTPSLLAVTVIKIAAEELDVREDPPGSNKGPRVDEYLRSVDLGPGFQWCAAFVFFCFKMACLKLNMPNPLPKTGGCMQLWKRSKGKTISLKDALANPSLVVPGLIFIISRGDGKGHTGIVIGVQDGYILTIEGNTNNTHSSEGVMVCALRRKINTINPGFINYI
jgi:hypothetical protein